MNEPREDVSQLIHGIGVRAALLATCSLIVTGSVAALTLRAASSMVKFALGSTLLLLGATVAVWEVQKITREITEPRRIA